MCKIIDCKKYNFFIINFILMIIVCYILYWSFKIYIYNDLILFIDLFVKKKIIIVNR